MTKAEETQLANLQAKKKDKKYALTPRDTLFLKKLTAKKKKEGSI
jgi:hypothetical protein